MDRKIKLKLSRENAAVSMERRTKSTKKRYDRNRLDAVQYKIGDMVMVERTPIVTGIASGKLVQKFIGPVQITHVFVNDRYRVQSLSKDKRQFKGVVANDRLKFSKFNRLISC